MTKFAIHFDILTVLNFKKYLYSERSENVFYFHIGILGKYEIFTFFNFKLLVLIRQKTLNIALYRK